MQLHWIWYAMLKGISCQRKRQLLEIFRSPDALFLAQKKDLEQVQGIKREEIPVLMNKDLTEASQIRIRCKERGIGILALADSGYPDTLRMLEDAPMVLYYMGQLPDWEGMPAIAMVGTRNATAHGLRIAHLFGAQAAACGGIVVSGGAKGIDGEALEGACRQGGTCIAVMAGGLDRWYPKENTPLFTEILQRGCLISEYPPGIGNAKWNFLQRNRLISGISQAVLVVEAPAKSGAMNTAQWAADQGKELYAVPGNVDGTHCQGSNQLLKDGCKLAFSAWDILEGFVPRYPGSVQDNREKVNRPPFAPEPVQPEKKRENPAQKDKKPIDNEGKSTYSVLNNDPPDLTPEEKDLVLLLTKEPVSVDSIVERAQISTAKAMTILTMLTMKGIAKNHPGRRISLK